MDRHPNDNPHIRPRQAPRDAEPEPDALTGCWGSVQAAARLHDLSVAQILQAAIDGKIRAERRRGELLVELSAVARLKVQGGTTA
jgi:hypothetical protein